MPPSTQLSSRVVPPTRRPSINMISQLSAIGRLPLFSLLLASTRATLLTLQLQMALCAHTLWNFENQKRLKGSSLRRCFEFKKVAAATGLEPVTR